MKRALQACVLSLATLTMNFGAAVAASDWPMTGHDAASTYFNPVDSGITVQNAGRLHSIWAAAGITRAIVGSGRVYAAVNVGAGAVGVEALDLNGRRLSVITPQTLQLGTHRYDVPSALAFSAGRLIVASPSILEAVNPATGARYWRDAIGADSISIDGDTIFTGQQCGAPCQAGSYAVSVSTGRILWRHQENGGGGPVVVLRRVFQRWGYARGVTRIYDAATGAMAAVLPYDAMVTGSTAAVFADVAGPAGRSWLGRLSATGKPLWKFDLGKPERTVPPVYAYGTLFVLSHRIHPGVVAVSQTGTYRWGAYVGSNISSVACSNHLLFLLHRRNGKIDVLDTTTGRQVARPAVPYFAYDHNASLFVAGGTLFVLAKGTLTAMHP
ncbi:MAG TPA: PQQ-binding-like beta-propeller repeat protein [Chloroflexota bacterium]|nr:PQQ-binding-like beta-propeller repeat protein [Chloroflexota bacterium]